MAKDIVVIVLRIAGPVVVMAILLSMQDQRWRFSLSLIFALMTAVALTVWAWATTLIESTAA